MMHLTKRKVAETTRLITEKGVPRISYLSLEKYPWLINAFSTREGGVSTGMYTSMNLAFTRGDDPEKVRKAIDIAKYNYEKKSEERKNKKNFQ